MAQWSENCATLSGLKVRKGENPAFSSHTHTDWQSICLLRSEYVLLCGGKWTSFWKPLQNWTLTFSQLRVPLWPFSPFRPRYLFIGWCWRLFALLRSMRAAETRQQSDWRDQYFLSSLLLHFWRVIGEIWNLKFLKTMGPHSIENVQNLN